MSIMKIELEGGDLRVQTRNISEKNIEYIINEGGLNLSKYITILSSSLIRFRKEMNRNFSMFVPDLGLTGILTLEAGDSWAETRRKTDSNFDVIEEALVGGEGEPSGVLNPDGQQMMNPDGSPSINLDG